MNKSSRSLVFLLILALASLCLPFRIQIQQVRATYAWGPIVKDTVWTLVDSPFVISGDVVIYPGATLTIEPAVEVRFGGNFSIIVEGALIASSAGAANVKFTSNALNPAPGDWGTILLSDTNSFASLSNCTIEYATNGIMMETGSLTIKDSDVKSNSENGIAVANGTASVDNNIFENNTESGIYIEGNNQALIRNNNFTLNADGIMLAGNLNPNANIQQNLFFNNTHSGISLEADPISNTLIAENTFSGNNYGLQVSTNASTNIANNYILNNNVGIIYKSGSIHQAHFNDIYDNTMGMDVSGDAEVNAQYDYWGDKSGPEHDYLNPDGKGNPVGGNGTNLNFIFFLTRPFEYQYSNSAPIAVLQTDKTLIGPNQNVTFIGTGSYDDGQVDQYYFDFGDGTTTGWITTSLFSHSYTAPGTYTSSLRVKDDFNVASQNIATASITVQQNLMALNVAVTPSIYTTNFDENVSITIYVSTGAGPADNANVTPLSVGGGSFTPISPLPNSPGYFTTVFTAPNVTRVTDIRIIASASLNGYADGSDYTYLKVLPPLYVQTTANPSVIISESTSTIMVDVTWNSNPVSNATVTVSSSIGGNFSSSEETTDSNGYAVFVFIAPQITIHDAVTANITIDAHTNGYVDAESYVMITVVPKILILQIAAQPSLLTSGVDTNVTVHVTSSSDLNQVSDVNVTIASENGGNFSATTGLTDRNGDVTFLFTAPLVNASTNVTISALAQKSAYADGQNVSLLMVNPGNLTVQVKPSSLTVASGESTVIDIFVTSNSTYVANASVTISSNYGNFAAKTAMTDSSGHCAFLFNAPRTKSQLSAVITATVMKNGFVSSMNQTMINVTPEVIQTVGGLPLTTLLLIIIPIIIVVIVVVLIKLKVLSISYKEEEE